jgi:hypothetical protein
VTDSKKEVVKAAPKETASVVDAASGVIPRSGDVISRYIRQDERTPEERTEEVYRSIIEAVLQSPDANSVLELIEAEGLKDYVGRVIDIAGFSVNDSDYEQGAQVYVAIRAIDVETKTRRIITTGWQRVMAQLLRLQQLDAFPVRCTVHQAKRPNQHGSYPLQLVATETING